jgi:hypothetical protein
MMMSVEQLEEKWQDKPKYLEKTCLSATLSKSPTLPDLGSNLSCRGGKAVTNQLSCGTAFTLM